MRIPGRARWKMNNSVTGHQILFSATSCFVGKGKKWPFREDEGFCWNPSLCWLLCYSLLRVINTKSVLWPQFITQEEMPTLPPVCAWVGAGPSPGEDQATPAACLLSCPAFAESGKGLLSCLAEEGDASGKDSFCGVACQEARQRSGKAL